jgi:hypothetical protein
MNKLSSARFTRRIIVYTYHARRVFSSRGLAER